MADIEFLPLPRTASPEPEPKPAQGGVIHSPEAAPPAITFRSLTPEEIQREVEPDYAATQNHVPDPAISTFIGAFSGNDLLAYLCLQVKLHAQPLVIRQGHGAVLPGLVHAAEAHILATAGPQWVYLFTPAGKLAQMASAMGMQLEPWVVMSKLVAPAMPPKPAFEVVQAKVSEPGPFLDEGYQARPGDDAWKSLGFDTPKGLQ